LVAALTTDPAKAGRINTDEGRRLQPQGFRWRARRPTQITLKIQEKTVVLLILLLPLFSNRDFIPFWSVNSLILFCVVCVVCGYN
jgi:hypothetical protein